MIETVGVGQDEVDIVRLADVTIVILVPGMGDDVQTIKAGIMEIADIFVINKSDREGAERVEREIRAMQSLATRNDRWTPPIVKTVASEGVGTEELAEAIANYEAFLKKENLAFKKNVENWQLRLVEMLRDAMLEKARAQMDGGAPGALRRRNRRAQARSVFAGGGDCAGRGNSRNSFNRTTESRSQVLTLGRSFQGGDDGAAPLFRVYSAREMAIDGIQH